MDAAIPNTTSAKAEFRILPKTCNLQIPLGPFREQAPQAINCPSEERCGPASLTQSSPDLPQTEGKLW